MAGTSSDYYGKQRKHKWDWLRSVWLTYLGLVAVAAVSEVLINFVGKTPAKFFGLILTENYSEFNRLLLYSLLLFAVSAAFKALVHFMGGRFMIAFRCSLTHLLQNVYMTSPTFYQLNSQSQVGERNCFHTFLDCDSPDQRLTDDVIRFSEAIRVVVEKCSVLPFLLVYYSYQCYDIGGVESLVVIYGYFILSSLVSGVCANKLVWLTYVRDRAEGHFRYHHLRMRTFAESIAIMNMESFHLQNMITLFDRVILKTVAFVNSELLPRFCIYLFSDFAAILSYAVVAIALTGQNQRHKDKEELAVLISLNLFYTMYLLNNLTQIISLVDEFSSIAGYTSRIYQMLETSCDPPPNTGDSDDVFMNEKSCELIYTDEILKVDELKYRIGNCRQVHIPSFTVYNHDEATFQLIMIQGPSGSGKSTFFKILGDMWPTESGKIHFNSDNAMFLPQQPYLLTNATLRQQLTLDNTMASSISDDEIRQAIQAVDLTDTITNLDLCGMQDMTLNFDPKQTDLMNRLSPGELQKLCFARLLIRRPKIIFMDESTSYMDAESERKCFDLLRQMQVTCFWITHANKSNIAADTLMDFSGRVSGADDGALNLMIDDNCTVVRVETQRGN